MGIKKERFVIETLFIIHMAATYFPGKIPVSSAMMGLTTLFGMGRGEHHRQYHHNKVNGQLLMNNC